MPALPLRSSPLPVTRLIKPMRPESPARLPVPSRQDMSSQSSALLAVSALLLAAVVPVCRAAQPGAHVHGAASLEIAIDGPVVSVSLHSPLGNLSGFEHAPRNENERRQIRTMATRLRQADSLFAFTPAARCQPETASLESAVLEPVLLAATAPANSAAPVTRAAPATPARQDRQTRPVPSSPTRSPGDHGSHTHKHDDHAHPADTHAELDATWQFRCATPAALQDVDVQALFRTFPGIRQLDAMVAGPRKQSGSRLSPGTTRLKW